MQNIYELFPGATVFSPDGWGYILMGAVLLLTLVGVLVQSAREKRNQP